MIVHAALLATLLAGNPFPQPRLTPVTDRLKCDTGKVLSVDANRAELSVMTGAGAVVYRAGGDVQVFDKGGMPLGAVSRLMAGQRVRVYYIVADGAVASEIVTE